ncbi:Mpv17/PMP22 family protein [Aspergillus undulatus]|uniref:Mpv17/PMP22 family protein n=1 Tax=Aspergillus undulatus TaxID=1810928 RepID=UPI003CCD54DC
MALPPIAKATLQAALISAGSNVLAQGITSYRDGTHFELDTQTLFQFTTSALILSPLTFLWLEALESRFPGFEQRESEKGKKERENQPKINVWNTVAKIVVDQVIGGAWNTVAFIATMGMLRGHDYEVIKSDILNNFFPFMLAGLKLWPFVSILNFTVVPADQRLLVGNLFGVVWGVYLSLMAA